MASGEGAGSGIPPNFGRHQVLSRAVGKGVMTNPRQNHDSDKTKAKPGQIKDYTMTKEGKKLWLSNCPINPFKTHRWSQAFKDKISKTQYFQVLRCRYCTQFLLIQFERVVLPSGRVTVWDHMDIVRNDQLRDHAGNRVTYGLRKKYNAKEIMKLAEHKLFESLAASGHML